MSPAALSTLTSQATGFSITIIPNILVLTAFQFLDFSQIPNYHQGFFKSLGPAVPNTPLDPGIKMHNVLEGMTFKPTLLVCL
jgi:hypothetical protein